MGDSECRECKKQEEAIYWNYFQSSHFFLPLSGQFHHQLAIPEKFVNNVREKLAEAVTIKGPSGTTWEVGLTADNNALFFKHGWQKFVEDHSLEENDVLFFKYSGNSCFEVKMFDPQNCCEKEDSYFVRKCEHRGLVNVREKRNASESFDVMEDSSHEADKSSPSVKHVKVDVQTPEPVTSIRPTRRVARRANNDRQGPSSTSMGYPVQYVSKRRPVTDEEKETALQMANAARAASAKDSFIVVMRATHVYKTFFMSIPAEWLYSHLPSNVNEVILRMQGKTWNARVYRKVSGGGLMGGWKSFALENFLEEHDVCFFQLEDEVSDGTVLDVQIFRVVEEVIPPTRLTSTNTTSSIARGRKTSKRQRKNKSRENGA